ncbi:hypothetical protein QKA_2598 [Clostridioides difficile DA00165]|nr:hypothetical protein QKA_2598 [Clostridioides difficile DA00165]
MQNALRPIPDAKAKGRLATTPIKIHPNAAAKQVPVQGPAGCLSQIKYLDLQLLYKP